MVERLKIIFSFESVIFETTSLNFYWRGFVFSHYEFFNMNTLSYSAFEANTRAKT